jgi:hypothetical protein
MFIVDHRIWNYLSFFVEGYGMFNSEWRLDVMTLKYLSMRTRNWGQSQAGKRLKRIFFVDIPCKVKGHSNSLTFPCIFRVVDRSISRQIVLQACFAGNGPCRKSTM